MKYLGLGHCHSCGSKKDIAVSITIQLACHCLAVVINHRPCLWRSRIIWNVTIYRLNFSPFFTKTGRYIVQYRKVVICQIASIKSCRLSMYHYYFHDNLTMMLQRSMMYLPYHHNLQVLYHDQVHVQHTEIVAENGQG